MTASFSAEEMDLSPLLLHRDGLMLVIDKPAGLPVHRGPKGGPCLEDHFRSLRFGLPRDPGLAHRLDRDTSGCLILGRHRKALEQLGALFKRGAIRKTYWAVVEGEPKTEEGVIDLPLGRLDASRGWWMKADPAGAAARTLWRVRGRAVRSEGPIAWIEFEPLTGRTHQIRVHAASLGWPILGDAIYGGRGRTSETLHLLARAVAVPIKRDAEPVLVTAPPPDHMRERLAQLGWSERPPAPARSSS